MNRPPEPFDVEPLSARDWERIEHNLFAALDRQPAPPPAAVVPRRAWMWAAAGCAAVAAAAVALWPRAAGEPAAPQVSRIATGDEPSRVSFGDIAADVAPHSALVISGDGARGAVAVLERGAARFAVEPRRGRPAFVVHAGDVRVTVIGTEFAVARHGDGASVEVYRGTVEIAAPGEPTQRVGAGHRWPARAAAATAGDSPAGGSDGSNAAPDAGIDARAARDARRDGDEAGDGRRAGDDRDRPAAARDRRRRSTAPRDRGRSGRPLAAQSAAPAPSPRDRYDRAARLEATDPSAAAAIYRDLARGAGPWAANALFAHARLELDRGRPARARELLEAYLRRFPRGANAADARALLERLP
ncbi:MAG: hypothetical protein D6689_04345 [Deltaproteobacteria bacterium]|nr:MAG: hypothetical protein D6689_04345 [Deltaproteobacteria bacterium]